LAFPNGAPRAIRKGLSREQAYELVQRASTKTWQTRHSGATGASFLVQLKEDSEVSQHFASGELEKLCSLDFHFKQVKARFKKLGLD
jgi:adenylosuccinate lyase